MPTEGGACFSKDWGIERVMKLVTFHPIGVCIFKQRRILLGFKDGGGV